MKIIFVITLVAALIMAVVAGVSSLSVGSITAGKSEKLWEI